MARGVARQTDSSTLSFTAVARRFSRRARNGDRCGIVGVRRRGAELILDPHHFAINLLDLGHERFLALGQLNELAKGGARNPG
jgi:hypothetical protein